MFETLPASAMEALDWGPDSYTPYLEALVNRDLSAETMDSWLRDWSKLAKLALEVYSRLYVGTTVDTTDSVAEARYTRFLETIFPVLKLYENRLNDKLLQSGIVPEGMATPLRSIRADVDLFREENLPLLAEEQKLAMAYDKLVGAQTVEWEGREVTLAQLMPVAQDTDRAKRESAWRLAMARMLQDREALNALWVTLMDVRGKLAANAGLPDYRAYRWKAMHRFDYTPQDSETFQQAIAEAVVPAAARLYERRREKLGLDTVRPWDTEVDLLGRPALRPYETIEQLNTMIETIFTQVDPQLGGYFKTMRDEKLLDLENRKGKAPGGYCTEFPLAGRPFIFMNAVGLHEDVQTLLHEGGHAFHVFETAALPYAQQIEPPLEFAEVASMGMELIASPYLAKSAGGLYSDTDAARARTEHLLDLLRFWPYMAVVDAFQHWVYMNHAAASDPANCDAKWTALWDRYMVGIDYSGFEDIKATGWHRKLHIFQVPFYYVEYGLAQLGAVQVWANSLIDHAQAVRSYRKALALGGTAPLPELFATAGAKLAFDTGTLSGAVQLVEMTLQQLNPS